MANDEESDPKLEKEIKQLSDMRDNLLKTIEDYNRIATKINFESRIGLMEATCHADEYEDDEDEGVDKVRKTYDELVEDEWDRGSGPYVRPIERGTAVSWFPSSFC